MVGYVAQILPILAALVLLRSRKVTLVKALLIVMLVNYIAGIGGTAILMFTGHIASFSAIAVLDVLYSLFFLWWTGSVFSQLKTLST
jgi:hypothetical protein